MDVRKGERMRGNKLKTESCGESQRKQVSPLSKCLTVLRLASWESRVVVVATVLNSLELRHLRKANQIESLLYTDLDTSILDNEIFSSFDDHLTTLTQIPVEPAHRKAAAKPSNRRPNNTPVIKPLPSQLIPYTSSYHPNATYSTAT